MGDWIITVHGCGSHHNSNNQQDADLMARRFAEDLVNAGHHVKHAEIRTFGSSGRRQNLLTGDDFPEPTSQYVGASSSPTVGVGPHSPPAATAPGSVATPDVTFKPDPQAPASPVTATGTSADPKVS